MNRRKFFGFLGAGAAAAAIPKAEAQEKSKVVSEAAPKCLKCKDRGLEVFARRHKVSWLNDPLDGDPRDTLTAVPCHACRKDAHAAAMKLIEGGGVNLV